MKDGNFEPAESPGRSSIVIFGAGNIGRSFIGQLFGRAGWEPVFVDTNSDLVGELNRRGSYRVVVKDQGSPDRVIEVGPVRAVEAADRLGVTAAVMAASMAATAVGKNALPAVMRLLAPGLVARAATGVPTVLDVILAENVHGAQELCLAGLKANLPDDFPSASYPGLIETSIGKMVPIMRREDLAGDPLCVFAEPFNTLIVDGRAFRNAVPAIPDLLPVANIAAWVERKLFIHNLGHAAIAYLGYRARPDLTLLWQALELREVRAGAEAAMHQAGEALLKDWPGEFSPADIDAHISDLLHRFANRALGDTIHRVGRDLPRKLHKSDRIVGAIMLAERHGLAWDAIADVFRAALSFRAADHDGRMFPSDDEFHGRLLPLGARKVLERVCGLERTDPLEAYIHAALSAYFV